MRLKTAQIGYNFPKRWINQLGVEKVRLYIEGYNLFTISGLTKYNIDPESPAVNNGYYPQQRTYTFGINLTF
ncbi:TonB-dependent receptor [Bacteroides sp. BFG-637]|nr:TonB-dependent receptor [Bacteroides sp. BFG-637]MCS3313481.1 TonB-dependent receptor [Bacteroides sp. BFG-637]